MSDIENTFYKSIINSVRQKNINYAMDEFEKSSITIQRKICINVIIIKLGIVEHKVMEYQKFFENMDKKHLIFLKSNKKYIKQ